MLKKLKVNNKNFAKFKKNLKIWQKNKKIEQKFANFEANKKYGKMQMVQFK